MISGGELLAGAAAPAVAGLVLGLGGRWLPAGRPAWAGAALALSAAGGYAALGLVQGAALLPPADGFHWLLWYTAALGLALLLPLATAWRVPVLVLATAGLWWLALRPLTPHALGSGHAAILGAALGAAGLALGAAAEATLRRWPCTCGGTAAVVVLGALAIDAALAGSLKLGQFAGITAAAAGGLLLAHLRRSAPPAGLGWATGLLLTAHLGVNLTWAYSSLTWPSAALLLLALPAGWIAHLPPIARRPRLQAAVRIGVVALVALLALAWTALYGQPGHGSGHGDAGGFSY